MELSVLHESQGTGTEVHVYNDINYQFTDDPILDIGKNFGNLDDILLRGELVVCGLKNGNAPIFHTKIKTGYVGEDIEVAHGIAEALGVKLTYKMIYNTHNDVVDAVANHKGDIGIAKLSYTPERGRKVLYSDPYVNSRKAILINRNAIGDAENIMELLNSKKATIAVAQNTSYESFAKQLFPQAILDAEKDWEGLVMEKLEKGEIMATMRDEFRIRLLLNSRPRLLLKLLPIILKNEKDAIAAVVNKQSNVLLSWINTHLSISHNSIAINRLMDKYMGYVNEVAT
jgi:polar amino acid transport system substrate-binding protein